MENKEYSFLETKEALRAHLFNSEYEARHMYPVTAPKYFQVSKKVAEDMNNFMTDTEIEVNVILKELEYYTSEVKRLEEFLFDKAKQHYFEKYGYNVESGDSMISTKRAQSYTVEFVFYHTKLIDEKIKYSCSICYYQGYEGFNLTDDFEDLLEDGYIFNKQRKE